MAIPVPLNSRLPVDCLLELFWDNVKMVLGYDFRFGERHLAENRFQMLRARLCRMLGLSVVGEARRSNISYSKARRKAKRLWPLWAW